MKTIRLPPKLELQMETIRLPPKLEPQTASDPQTMAEQPQPLRRASSRWMAKMPSVTMS